MEKKEKEVDNKELRSEKVRNEIGKVPPNLVRLGNVIITIIFLAIAVAFYKIPYPISIDANGEVVNQRTVQVFVPYKYLWLFEEPRAAHIYFEGNDRTSYQYDILSYNANLLNKQDGNYFVAIATMREKMEDTTSLQKHMKAYVRIIVSNKTLWQYVFE
mgnify:FL=1